MRDAKFRGKRIDNGEWVVGFHFCMTHTDGRHEHHFIIPLGCDLSKNRPIGDIQVEVIQETIGEYTGCHDKNGDEVFERMWVTCPTYSRVYKGEVVFDKACRFAIYIDEGISFSNCSMHHFPIKDFKNIEISKEATK